MQHDLRDNQHCYDPVQGDLHCGVTRSGMGIAQETTLLRQDLAAPRHRAQGGALVAEYTPSCWHGRSQSQKKPRKNYQCAPYFGEVGHKSRPCISVKSIYPALINPEDRFDGATGGPRDSPRI